MSNQAATSDGSEFEKPSTLEVARRRFLSNVGSNVSFVVINSALMVWYIPFLVHHLGVAAYGMIPLANMLVMYASIISNSLNVSIGRFLAIDLNRHDVDSANRTFNTALAISLVGCAIVIVPVAVVTYYFPVLFNVPSGLETPTQFMFVGVAITTLSAMISGNFAVASLITHRFDLRNLVRVLTSVSRVGVVVACFMIWPASLWHITVGFIISAAINLVGDIVVWKIVTPQLRVNRREIDTHQFKALINLSGWSLVNQLGMLLLMQVDLLVVNAVFGADMTGRYGSLLLFPTLIHMVMESVVAVLSPMITACYAVGDSDGIRRIAERSTKLIGLGLAIPIGLLCGFSAPLLTLWLGPSFAQLDLLLVLLVAHLSVNLATRPLAYVLTAYNRVRVQGLVTLLLGMVNIGLAIALARWSGLGVLGIAVAAAIVWTLKNVLILPSYSAGVMRLPWWTFYTPLAAGAVGTLAVAVAGRIVTQYWWPASWLSLILTAGGIATLYCAAVFVVGLNGSDRRFVRSIFDRRSRR